MVFSTDWFRGLMANGIQRPARLAGLMLVALVVAGCAGGAPSVSNRALLAHLPGIDFSGLSPVVSVDAVKASCPAPANWSQRPLEHKALYTQQQWRSPSEYTAVGILYARMPLPMSVKSLLWFAKLQYGKATSASGKALGEWTDELGREWFEAENDKYHVRGYAVTDGFDAWVIYTGYKLDRPISPSELNLAMRCIDAVVPQTSDRGSAKPSVVAANTSD